MITVFWSNSLERLADDMFSRLESERVDSPAEVFGRQDCIVVPNRILQYWLQHRFLFRDDEPAVPRVFANAEFPLLNVFVNDWLFRMDQPGEAERDPAAHPFAAENMAWRIHGALGSEAILGDAAFRSVRDYIAPPAGVSAAEKRSRMSERRRFRLASRLAALFDEYMVYRPDMLIGWERGRYEGVPEPLLWEPRLWRALAAGPLRDRTYLAAFQRMGRGLRTCGVEKAYRRVRVFGAAMMPRVYLLFFDALSELLPVEFYAFNPCRDQWTDQPSPREVEKEERRRRLEGAPDDEALFDAGNPMLGALGRGCRDFTGELIDLTEGQAADDSLFVDPGRATLLAAMQSEILRREPKPGSDSPRPSLADGSVQIHVCHSPMREVEVLRDHLLRGFAEDPGLQPRHVQVQVSDMAVYAPYIDAVFATASREAADTIPYVIADRVLAGESQVAEAFVLLLESSDSRFTAREVVDLLQCESIREAFGFAEGDVDDIKGWVASAGIRWGRDARHREQAVGVGFTEMTTWRRGLDSLLLGYARGRESAAPGGGAIRPPNEGFPLPADCVEGDDAVTLGRLVRFFDSVEQLARDAAAALPPGAWADRLDRLIDTFFASTDETYRDIQGLRGAVAALRRSAAAGDFAEVVRIDVVRDFVAGQLESAIGGDELLSNAVVFSALRPGSSAPRRVMALLGMGDGEFPRGENRPAYDLFRVQRKRGDRSRRIEDRMAWLEALMSARDRLYVSYTGHTALENEEIPPSVLVKELCEYLAPDEAARAEWIVNHRLQAYHPEYFREPGRLFSYSGENCRAAATLLAGPKPRAASPEGAAPSIALPSVLELDKLIEFLRNPARAYYRGVLGVRLEMGGESALGDTEEFDPRGLTGFQVNEAVIEAMFRDEPPDAVRLRLSERGLVPLAHWGRRWLAERWEEMGALLDCRFEGLGRLGDAIRAQEGGEERELEVPVAAGVTLSGKVRTVPGSGKSGTAVDFRCTIVKDADRLAGWIRHVAACAAGLPEVRWHVQGRTADQVEAVRWAALDAGEAKDILGVYVEAFRQGQAAIPPFTPATAHAYVETLRKKAGDPDGGEKAMKAAEGAWYSNEDFGRFGDDGDLYFRAAFGPGGPFGDEAAFGACAESLVNPLVERTEAVKPDKEGGEPA